VLEIIGIATWKFPLSLKHVGEVAGVPFSDSASVPKFLNLIPGPLYFQI